MSRNVKLRLAVNAGSKFQKRFKLHDEKIGDITCWRDYRRICTSECAAWDSYEKEESNTTIVRCGALPYGRDSCLAAIPGKEKTEKEGELDE